MERLIKPDGTIDFGLYDQPVGQVNYLDYHLETPLGWTVPRPLKQLVFNQFVFLGLISPEFVIGMAVVDLKYLANGFFYVFDRANRQLIEVSKLAIPGGAAVIDTGPNRISARFVKSDLIIRFDGGRFSAQSRQMAVEGELTLDQVRPLRICTRAGYRGWVYKQSTTPLPAQGHLQVNGSSVELDPASTLALVDWSCGYMRRHTYWNWAATAGCLPDGRHFGMNLSCGVNETSFTENYFVLDSQLTKVDTVNFSFNQRDLYQPWRLASIDRRVCLTFHPTGHRGELVNALVVKSRFTQMFGLFHGRLLTELGEPVSIEGVPGWVEDHYAKW